jgi:hypothetical protein
LIFGLAAERKTVHLGKVGQKLLRSCVVAKRSIAEVPAISIDNAQASGRRIIHTTTQTSGIVGPPALASIAQLPLAIEMNHNFLNFMHLRSFLTFEQEEALMSARRYLFVAVLSIFWQPTSVHCLTETSKPE